MEETPIAVWSERNSAAYTTGLSGYLGDVVANGRTELVKGNYENIFAFLESASADLYQTVVLEDALTKYTSESNYRRALALLFERGKASSAALVSELLVAPNLPVIFRALRALGVERYVEVAQVENRCIVSLKRGRAQLNAKSWGMDWAPFMKRDDSAAAVQSVIRSIQQRVPFSMIRVGHCEVRFLAHRYLYGDSDIDASASLQWGQSVDRKKTRWIQENLVRTIENANMLGYKSRAAFSSKPLKIFENSVSACLSELSLLRPGQTQVDPNVHFALGKSVAFLAALSNAETLVIISPRKELESELVRLFGDKTTIKMLDLPGEFRIDGPADIETRFARFREIEEQVAQLTGRGVVFLVGAGVAGKQYCEIARAGGGVGLDLGSTLDAWAGIDSRGGGFPPELKGAIETYQASTQ
jgi:hypothetical protein